MSRYLSILIAAALAAVTIGVGAPGGTPASAAPSKRLTVQPSFDCDYPEYGGVCATELSVNTGVPDDGFLSAKFKVTNLRTGATQNVSAYSTLSETYGETTRRQLSKGKYHVALVIRTIGYWSCSKYDPDGCSWIPGGTERYQWALSYAPGKTVKVRELVPPFTKATKVRWRSAGKGKTRLTGVVVGRALKPDFTLGKKRRLGKRAVRYEEKLGGKWRLIAKARTKRNGRFETRPMSVTTKAKVGRIRILGKGKYPAGVRIVYLN